MLSVTVHDTELYDEEKNEFIYIKGQTFNIEHSLISVDKWESQTHKPFVTVKQWDKKHLLDYVKCMVVSKSVDLSIIDYLPDEELVKIQKYMEDPMSATIINDGQNPRRKEGASPNSSHQITSEEIYYLMSVYQIPLEFEKRHFNKLMVLLKIFEIKNRPEKNKKMSKQDLYARQRAINAANRAKYKSRG